VSDTAPNWQAELKFSVTKRHQGGFTLKDIPRRPYPQETGPEKQPLSIIEQDPSKGCQKCDI
jgi:hypothetical protein